MLVIALGTIASGSTWAFNVARGVFARVRPQAVSLSVGHASDLLANISPDFRDVIVKAHFLDNWLLTLAALFQAKVIVTTRDPRDSLVSQRERFGATLHEAVTDLTRSAATLATLHESVPVLRLRYEDGFMNRPETVERIAAFLELPIDRGEAGCIFDEYRAENVTRAVDRWQSTGKLKETGYEAATHWHEGHVGDCVSGKWRQRLRSDDQEAVMGAVGSDLLDSAIPEEIYWSPKLFTYFDERSGSSAEMLNCNGEEQALLWGPYQHLPTGHWRISPQITLDTPAQPLSIRVDTFIPVQGREVLALRVINLPASSPERLVMEFDHYNHLDPIELRISSIGDCRQGRITFRGAELKRLGPSERTECLAARPVRAEPRPLSPQVA